MSSEFLRLVSLLFIVYSIAIVPSFLLMGSFIESFGFVLVLLSANYMFTVFVLPVYYLYNYINPTKVLGGTHGLSNAWVWASPVGLSFFLFNNIISISKNMVNLVVF